MFCLVFNAICLQIGCSEFHLQLCVVRAFGFKYYTFWDDVKVTVMCLVCEVVWVDLRKPCDNFSLSSAVGASVTGIPLDWGSERGIEMHSALALNHNVRWYVLRFKAQMFFWVVSLPSKIVNHIAHSTQIVPVHLEHPRKSRQFYCILLKENACVKI